MSVRKAKCLLYFLESGWANIDLVHLCACLLCKQRRAYPNGAYAGNQNAIIRRDVRSAHRMSADGKELDHRRFSGAKAIAEPVRIIYKKQYAAVCAQSQRVCS